MEALSWNHRLEAAYRNIKLYPDNPNMIYIEKRGLPPRAVQRKLSVQSNQNHGGAGNSHLEHLIEAGTSWQDWSLGSKERGLAHQLLTILR